MLGKAIPAPDSTKPQGSSAGSATLAELLPEPRWRRARCVGVDPICLKRCPLRRESETGSSAALADSAVVEQSLQRPE